MVLIDLIIMNFEDNRGLRIIGVYLTIPLYPGRSSQEYQRSDVIGGHTEGISGAE